MAAQQHTKLTKLLALKKAPTRIHHR